MSTVSLWRWDPFAEFDGLVREALAPRRGEVRERGFVPAAEVVRREQDAVVSVELPGVDAARDVAVEVHAGRLVVRGERRDERSGERGRRELRYGAFRREFVLPDHVTPEAVTATYDAGILNVRVAGAFADAEPHRVPITTGGAERAAVEKGEPAA
ncbi:Hsp20/alpha crystallin family protein [Actinocorallia populi]|uniref:Hsp20/alpha crystallin family protein n=1 Tax=Actinocorallia populi TaxID=2079200 RepID=UPI000D088216|nr:Hsp20/alpha crystallin family protein [Actinocorallia populi]